MSKLITKKKPQLKENLIKAISKEGKDGLIALDNELAEALKNFDQMSDQMGVTEFIQGRIDQTTKALAEANEKGISQEEKAMVEQMIVADQISIKALGMIDAMVNSNEVFGKAVFEYASAVDLDEVFDDIEEKYGEEIAEEVYELSKKENLPVEEVLKKVIGDKAMAQSKPNEEKAQENMDDQIFNTQTTNLL